MKKEFYFALALSMACFYAFAQSGRDTTPPTDADITPQSSAPGSGGSAGSGPSGTGDSNTRMGDSNQSILRKKFKLMDTNGDGLISVEEARSTESLSQSFEQADSNKDDLLTLEEYQAVMDRGVGSSGGGGEMQIRPKPDSTGSGGGGASK